MIIGNPTWDEITTHINRHERQLEDLRAQLSSVLMHQRNTSMEHVIGTFAALQARTNVINTANGWAINDVKEIPEKLALVHSEVSEALECYRDAQISDLGAVEYEEDSNNQLKPIGFPTELADIVIRVMHLAAFLDINLEQVITEKLNYNETRGFRHGGKRA